MLEELRIEVNDTRPQGDPCPHDGTRVRWANGPCPEGRVGCAVLHRAWNCPTCGRWYKARLVPRVGTASIQQAIRRGQGDD